MQQDSGVEATLISCANVADAAQQFHDMYHHEFFVEEEWKRPEVPADYFEQKQQQQPEYFRFHVLSGQTSEVSLEHSQKAPIASEIGLQLKNGHVIDTQYKESLVLTSQLFGVTEEGHSVTLVVTGTIPSVTFEVPPDWGTLDLLNEQQKLQYSDRIIEQFESHAKIPSHAIHKVDFELSRNMYGIHRRTIFARVFVYSERTAQRIIACLSGRWVKSDVYFGPQQSIKYQVFKFDDSEFPYFNNLKTGEFSVYNCQATPLHQMLADQQVVIGHWAQVPWKHLIPIHRNELTGNFCTTQIVLGTDSKHLSAVPKNDPTYGTNTPMRIMYLDIEVPALQFPQAENLDDYPSLVSVFLEVTTKSKYEHAGMKRGISLVVNPSLHKRRTEENKGRPEVFPVYKKHIEHPEKDRPDNKAPRTEDFPMEEVHFTHTYEMLVALVYLIQVSDPDCLSGHNVTKFDLPYLMKYCEQIGIGDWFRRIGRYSTEFSEPILRHMEIKTRQHGTRDFDMVDIPGREQLDTMLISRKESKLSSYKLANIAMNELGDTKDDVPPRMIPILQYGSEKDLKRLVDYCVKDSLLCYYLVQLKQWFVSQMEMCRATGVRITDLQVKGMQEQAYSLIFFKSKSPEFKGNLLPLLSGIKPTFRVGMDREIPGVNCPATQKNPHVPPPSYFTSNVTGTPRAPGVFTMTDEEFRYDDYLQAFQDVDRNLDDVEIAEGEREYVRDEGAVMDFTEEVVEQQVTGVLQDDEEKKTPTNGSQSYQNPKESEEMGKDELRYLTSYKRRKQVENVDDDELNDDGEVDYIGAIVVPPKIGYYNEYITSVLDFNSLYPSIIQENNMCTSTILLRHTHPGRIHKFPLTLLRQRIRAEHSDHLDNDELFSLNLWDDRYSEKRESKVRFLRPEVRQGVICSISAELVRLRKEAKDEMKKAEKAIEKAENDIKALRKEMEKKGITESEREAIVKQIVEKEIQIAVNTILYAVFNSRQTSLKLVGNSVYGCISVNSGRYPCIEIGASVTARGRYAIEYSKKYIEETYGYTVIYGDTVCFIINDSLQRTLCFTCSKEPWKRVSPSEQRLLKRSPVISDVR